MFLFVFAAAFSMAWPCTMALAARSLRVVPHEVSIGVGPSLVTVKRGTTTFRLRAIPFGGFVRLEAEDDRRLSARRLGAIVVGAWSVLLVVSLLAGGSVRDVWAGVTLPVRAVHPLHALEAWNTALAEAPLATAGALGARLVAFNLLPLPGNAISLALLRPLARETEQRVQVAGVALLFGWAVTWLIVGFLHGA